MSRDPHTPEGIPIPKRRSPELPLNPSRFPAAEFKPDFSNLSANFSADSLTIDQDEAPITPSLPNFGQSNFVRYQGNDSLLSLNNSPSLYSTPSYNAHHRAGSNSNMTRPRPRSVFMADGFNEAILEDNVHNFDQVRLPPQPSDSRNNQHSVNFSPYGPIIPDRNHVSKSRSGSPVRTRSPVRASTSPQRRQGSPTKQFAFNFKPQEFGDNLVSPAPSLKPAQRKGHRYKHSSVSMNLFQEPLPIAETNQQPDLIPDLFIIPTVLELLASTTSLQKFKLILGIVHAITAAVVFLVGVRINQPSFSTLAHLVFYDSLGSIIIAFVDLMSNFEVWSEPSIAYPFGLGRLEVLAGFALSTSLVMVGCDLISHFVEEMILDIVYVSGEKSEHNSHHIHASSSGSTNWFLYELILLVVLAITWLSSICIVDQTSITDLLDSTDKKTMKQHSNAVHEKGLLDVDPNASSVAVTEDYRYQMKLLLKIFKKNPIRILTLVDSLFLFIVPFIPKSLKAKFGFDLNEASTFVVASTLCYVGWKLALTLGGILLISFPYSDYDYNVLKAAIYDKVLALPSFKPAFSISKIFLAKANHRLYIVGLDICIKGASSDDESRIIYDITKIISHAIKEFDDESQVETTVSVTR